MPVEPAHPVSELQGQVVDVVRGGIFPGRVRLRAGRIEAVERDPGARYEALNAAARALGSALRAPFMTLSFMALLVIPRLNLGDRGLFDGERFGFVPLCE